MLEGFEKYGVQVGAALAGGALISLVVGWWTGRGEREVQLPLHDDGNAFGRRDPLDLAAVDDLLDGYPVQEEEFWAKVRKRKYTMSVLMIIAVTINISEIPIWWTANQPTVHELAPSALQLVFALHVLQLSVRSVRQVNVKHAQTIFHLSGLALWACLILSTAFIVPNTAPKVTEGAVKFKEAQTYAVLALYTLMCVTSWTTPTGPPLYYPFDKVYGEKTVKAATTDIHATPDNVCGLTGASLFDTLVFNYISKVASLGHTTTTPKPLEVADLPIVPSQLRAIPNYTRIRSSLRSFDATGRRILGWWTPRTGSGWGLLWNLVKVNKGVVLMEATMAALLSAAFFGPAFFSRQFIAYLEADPGRGDKSWGWVYVIGMASSSLFGNAVAGQLHAALASVSFTFELQLTTLLFGKTLVRKDVVSFSPPKPETKPSSDQDTPNGETPNSDATETEARSEEVDAGGEFSSKAQIMNLMTTDVERVSEFAWHLWTIVDSPIEFVIGTVFLYNLLGISSVIGLGVILLFIPINMRYGRTFYGSEEKLMKTRDERVSLVNELLGAMRTLKFMAWEGNFQKRVLEIRERELALQKGNYRLMALSNGLWDISPILVTLITFWHYAVVRGQPLTPSIAFTTLIVLEQLKFALNVLPDTVLRGLQCLVSLRRIEKYLDGAEVKPVPPLQEQPNKIAFQSCTVTWPQTHPRTSDPSQEANGRPDSASSTSPTSQPTQPSKFYLHDLALEFPIGRLSLICGKLGSRKSLLLLALLGEADVVQGQVVCPRSPLDALALLASDKGDSARTIGEEEWVVQGMCAYVPQVAWLRNATIKDNILFGLPYHEERYQQTLKVCALVPDLDILEDGDESEIGERGVNLSGGQKARVSLARAVYSRASILLLDDILSAVDAHTARHIYQTCLMGDLMKSRTVILVSHHVQLCLSGAAYVVALDNGRVMYEGEKDGFKASGIVEKLGQVVRAEEVAEEFQDDSTEKQLLVDIEEKVLGDDMGASSEGGLTSVSTSQETIKTKKKEARKLVEDETREMGHVKPDVWFTYLKANGSYLFWTLFTVVFGLATVMPVAENGWLKYWSESTLNGSVRSPAFFLGVYSAINFGKLVADTSRWFVLYDGAVRASSVLYRRLLESVLFADIRFHDTTSRGRLLNRFGQDIQGIDSNLPMNFGNMVISLLTVATSFITMAVVGGLPFVGLLLMLCMLSYHAAKPVGQVSRDMNRLASVSRSPVLSLCGETITGVPVVRAFGAPSKFLRDMLRYVDTNINPSYWRWGVTRWISIRFHLLSTGVYSVAGLVCLVTTRIDAALAGFTLAFASYVATHILIVIRNFVQLEQSLIALERVKEYSGLKPEPPHLVDPRPPSNWPSEGRIEIKDLVIKYAPELPEVLHSVSFTVDAGEKIGILGRTGAGKSTLVYSLFRFVEPSQGQILIDGLDITKIGLADLRGGLTIIPQDPTILSGTLRSTLDVFGEYQDAEIYEALRRVHLIPEGEDVGVPEVENANVFRKLDSPVSEGGENFSRGERQLLCMARAILKRSKIVVMDEATASVDYATDELISKTIRQEFAGSTIVTIAHRLRTVINYDRVMILDQGKIVEFDAPATLLGDVNSKFYALCKAAGEEELSALKTHAGL